MPAARRPGDQPGHRRRLAAAGRAEDRRVPRQHRLRLRRHADHDALVPDRQPEPHVAAALQHLRRLGVVEHEHRAVRQRPQPRRGEVAVGQLLAEERHLDAAVVRRQVVAAVRGDGRQDAASRRAGCPARRTARRSRRRGTSARRRGSGCAPATATARAAGARRHEQHGDGQVVAAGQVEHRPADRPGVLGVGGRRPARRRVGDRRPRACWLELGVRLPFRGARSMADDSSGRARASREPALLRPVRAARCRSGTAAPPRA